MAQRQKENLVIVFMRAPIEETVKTRHQAVFSSQETLTLYRSCVLDTLDHLEPNGHDIRIDFCPAGEIGMITSWLGPKYSYREPKKDNHSVHAWPTVLEMGLAVDIGALF